MELQNQNAASGTSGSQSLGESTEKKEDHAFLAVKEQRNKLRDELATTKAKLQAIEEGKLKEQNEFKTLFEQRDAQLMEERKKREQLESTVIFAHKRAAFRRELGAELAHDSYYNHVNFDNVVFNPETGSVDPNSVKLEVGNFLKEHSSLVVRNAGKMPNKAALGSAGTKSLDEMSAKELEDHIRSLHAEGKI